MERIREGGRLKPPGKRRHGADNLRDLTEHEVELQDGVRSRDRDGANRFGRDREIPIRNKQRIDEFLHREGGGGGRVAEDSTEERASEEDESERPWPSTRSSALRFQGRRVHVEKCACAKRSEEYCVSMNVSSSPARLSGEAAVSPPSSNTSARKKIKGTREDFEIEIAEVLCGLMKQSQSSNKKLESENSNGVGNDENEQLDIRQISQPKFTSEKREASLDGVPLGIPAMSMELQEEAVEPENPTNLTNETDSVEGMGSKKATVSSKEELLWCPNLDVDLHDSTMTKGNSTPLDIKNQEEIRINGKALERDGLVDLRLGPDHMAQNGTTKNGAVVAEKLAVRNFDTKHKLLIIDLEKEYEDHGSDGDAAGVSELEEGCQKQHRRAEPTLPKEKKTAQPSSKPAGMAIDGNTGTYKALQTSRCTTHQYIARNIYLHQQFLGMNKLYPAPAGSALIYGASPCSLSLTLPTTPSLGISMAANIKSTCGVKDKSSEAVFLQDPQPPNLPHGPAFFFPLTQNQAPLSTSASKSANSINNPSSSSNSASRAPVTSTLTYNYPNMAANEAPPRLAVLQNNGYPLHISTPFGSAPAFMGGAPPPHAMPFFNGSFYPPQMFHPSRPVVLPAPTGSSSSSQRKTLAGIGNDSGNRVEKRFQDQSSNGGVEINTIASHINFSSMARNPALSSNGQALPFGNSARVVNLMAPPVVGNWPSRSIPMAANSRVHQHRQAPTSSNLVSSPASTKIKTAP